MIGIHGGDDGDIRAKPEKAAIIFIRLYYTNITWVTPEITVIIDGDPPQKGIAAITAMSQDMGDEGRDRRLAMGAGHADIERMFGDQSQNLTPLQEGIGMLLIPYQFLVILWYRRGIDDQSCVPGDIVRILLIVDGDAFVCQFPGQGSSCLVISADFFSMEMKIPRQGAHPVAADADEI